MSGGRMGVAKTVEMERIITAQVNDGDKNTPFQYGESGSIQ
jgi:hypothetical protein